MSRRQKVSVWQLLAVDRLPGPDNKRQLLGRLTHDFLRFAARIDPVQTLMLPYDFDG
jgi:hypothetical protein